MVLLHGHLKAEVYGAENVGTAFYSKASFLRSFFKLVTQSGRRVLDKKRRRDRDCYVAIYAGPAELTETRVIPRTGDPVWNETHRVLLAHDVEWIKLLVKDHDRIAVEHMGEVLVSTQDLADGTPVEGWFPLRNKKGKELHGGGRLQFKLTFSHIDKNPLYSKGGSANISFSAVGETAYPEREGNDVILYQDAHCGSHLEHSLLPPIPLADNRTFRPCEVNTGIDLWAAIGAAKHLVYIANWHFQPERTNPFDAEAPCIGQLLKRKAAEGVRVLLALWDEIDSKDDVLVYTRIEKKLHGGGAPAYFRDTGVVVKLMPRATRAKQGLEKVVAERFGFAHHQKTVLLDTERGRQQFLTAFMGGIDFCDRNFDDCNHEPGSFRYEEGIMPWHDCMSAVTGPAAWDALQSFEALWVASAEEHKDKLLDMKRAPIAPSTQSALTPGSKNAWNTQIFRCMDSGSADLGTDLDDSEGIEAKGYRREKGIIVDAGLHSMYVHMIRVSKHYIWIENQYFTGSSYAWSKYNTVGADNLVPMEIALRCVRAIEAGERYAAYIVIPLHPERAGPQRSIMLMWTWLTIGMMFRLVAEALNNHGPPDAHPQDYLNFFCLGNRLREAKYKGQPNKEAEKIGSFPDRSFIHIHAKTMVQDDEGVTISSANLNERSLSGSRDTELGMGSWQPAHSLSTAKGELSTSLPDRQVAYPRGQVYGYRSVSREGLISPMQGADPLVTIGESIEGRNHKYMPPFVSL